MKLTIKKAEAEIARLQKYIEDSQPKGRFVPKRGEKYWCINQYGGVMQTTNDGLSFDEWNVLTGNCFRTKEEAEAYKEYKEALGRVTNYILDNHPFEPDWEDDEQKKCFIKYNFRRKRVVFDYVWWSQHYLLLPYLPSEEACEETLKECEDDLLIILNYGPRRHN